MCMYVVVSAGMCQVCASMCKYYLTIYTKKCLSVKCRYVHLLHLLCLYLVGMCIYLLLCTLKLVMAVFSGSIHNDVCLEPESWQLTWSQSLNGWRHMHVHACACMWLYLQVFWKYLQVCVQAHANWKALPMPVEKWGNKTKILCGLASYDSCVFPNAPILVYSHAVTWHGAATSNTCTNFTFEGNTDQILT